MLQTSVNEGLAGADTTGILVSIDGVGALFACEMPEMAAALRASILEITGRGDAAGDKTFRLEDASGRWSGSGRVRSDTRPLPLHLASAAGTVRMTMEAVTDRDGNATPVSYIQFATLFESIDLAHAPSDEGGESVWTVRFSCVKTGPITQAWQGLNSTFEGTLSTMPAAVGTTGHFAHKQIYSGLTKVIDPAQLEDSAQQVWDATGVANNDTSEHNTLISIMADATATGSPFTGGKVSRATLTRTGGIGARAVLGWDYDDAWDRIQNGGQYSTRSGIEPFTRVSLELLDTSSDCETVCGVYWPTFQAEDFAYRMSVRKLNRFKALITREYVNPGSALNCHTGAEPNYQIARISGGNVQVYVRRAITQSGAFTRLLLGRSLKRRSMRRFTLARLLKGTTAPDHQNLVETTNDTTFFGLPAGSVLFEGANLRTNLGLTGTYPFYMEYEFSWISGGHYLIEGWSSEISTSAAGITTGWQNVSSLTDCGLATDIPAQSGFSVFLA